MIRHSSYLFIILVSIFTIFVCFSKLVEDNQEDKLLKDSSNMKYIKEKILINNNNTGVCSNDFIFKQAKENGFYIECVSNKEAHILIIPINDYLQYRKDYVIVNKIDNDNIIAVNRNFIDKNYIRKTVLSMFNLNNTISIEEAKKISENTSLETRLKEMNLNPFIDLNFIYFKESKLINLVEDVKDTLKSETEVSCPENYKFSNNQCVQIIEKKEEINVEKDKIIVTNSSPTNELDSFAAASPIETLVKSILGSTIINGIMVFLLMAAVLILLLTHRFALAVPLMFMVVLLIGLKNILM